MGNSFVPYTPIRIMYSIAVVFVGLFIMAFIWFGLYYVVSSLSTAIASSMEQYENMTSYPSFGLAHTFMSNLWLFFLAIVTIALLYWVWLYAQRKNLETGYR